ncbi:hypothetical protein [Streptomyces sp. NPDC052225]|uniref:hypothetical protein n=1 Tax=Streptomyces sp. NPDC052225 TaxID=3154949 RepID=UPI0034231FCD
MNREDLRAPREQLLPTLALAVLAAAAWAGWLGWDQHRDEHPDGSSTGPYEAWQVLGLVVTLLPALYWAATRRTTGTAVTGLTAGLTGAAFYDWSDDASGLYMVGVIMVLAGTAGATAAGASVIRAVTDWRQGHLRPPAPPSFPHGTR